MQRKLHRILQINSLIKQHFGQIIHQELKTPEGVLVNVTRVKTSADLRHAQIGISIYPKEFTNDTFALICRQLKQLKFSLHQSITLKYAPDIKIYIDTSPQEAGDMEQLLNHIKEKWPENRR